MPCRCERFSANAEDFRRHYYDSGKPNGGLTFDASGQLPLAQPGDFDVVVKVRVYVFSITQELRWLMATLL